MIDKYKKILIEEATRLDNLVNRSGKILKYAKNIVENQDEQSTINLVKEMAIVISNKNCSDEIKKCSKLLNDNLIKYYGYIEMSNICNKTNENEDKRTLEELLKELNDLVGLNNVKNKVNDIISYQTVQKLRKMKGLNVTQNTMHIAFLGNPGTGKTTVARIIGHIYKQLGLLSKGHFIEVSRTDLIAGYQGQTALKVKKVIEKAKGGVLFIDEAYSITENDKSDSYGRECLTELTKALEDYRDDLVVIVAGYTEPMNKFFKSNPGLKSRFNTFIEFDDYNVNELEKILVNMCEKNDYILDEEVKEKIREDLNKKIENKDAYFSNGRLVRNIYDNIVMNHARRVVSIENPTRDILSIIMAQDLKEI